MAALFTDETLEPVEFKSTWKRERYNVGLAFTFFSSSVTYPAMGMSPLLPECYGTIDNPGAL